MSFCDNIRTVCQESNIAIEDSSLTAICQHWQLLQAANEQFNLTAITDPATAAVKHYLDCLLAAELLAPCLPAPCHAADIGSGGGFPGLVFAAALAGSRFTLIESAQKKAAFLADCARQMELADLAVLSLRAEEAGKDPQLRAGFDLVTARAVAELAVLAEYALPLLKVGGIFCAMKGPKTTEEITAAKDALAILGGEIEQTHAYQLPQNAGERSLIIIRKRSGTPDKYPRRPGMPVKKPL